MIQHGQVFKLKTRGVDGQPLWAYRYRLEGRGSERRQVGGFASRAEAEKALRKVLDRLGPGGGRATITLGEFVGEYLEMHQAAPVTIAKLRWLLGKATSVLGEKRLAELSPKDVYVWRLTVPEGHRYEATQALRQVLNRAVAWVRVPETRLGVLERVSAGSRSVYLMRLLAVSALARVGGVALPVKRRERDRDTCLASRARGPSPAGDPTELPAS